MQNISETQFLSNTKAILQDIKLTNEKINIISENSSYVLINYEEWQNISETLYLNRIPDMVNSIKKASQEPLSESISIEKLDW